MFGKIFYNKIFRSYINSFGTIFNDIYIGQMQEDDKTVKKIKVPIIYSSKEQYFSNNTNESNKESQLNLPIITYIQNGFVRKDDRRTAQKSEKVVLENGKFLVEAPQDWEMQLKASITTGSQNEMDQIIEQILFYFDPSFTIKLTLLKNTINFIHECPITLLSAGEVDNNWLGERTRRRITWELQFKFMVKLFGPIYVNANEDVSDLPFDLIETPDSLGEKINKIQIDLHGNGAIGEYYNYIDLQNFERQERIEIELEDGTVISSIENFYDGKIRNITHDPVDVFTGTLPPWQEGD